MLKVKDILIVSGVSAKGKARAIEHGPIWFVIDVRDGRAYLQSACTGYRRWMDIGGDRDFSVMEVRGSEV